MSMFVPDGLRPPGLFPAEPRVIYKTKRKNLTHEGRIGRMDRVETLNAFRDFSHAFNTHRPRLEPELGGYLHNHGFLPDKGALFGISPEMIDPEKPDEHSDWLGQYLSDFQTRILPLANGRYSAAGGNRLFLWRLHRQVLPLAPLIGSRQSGRVIRHAETGGPILSRTMETARSASPVWSRDLPEGETKTEAGDRVYLQAPQSDEKTRVMRIAILHDPRTKLPFVLGAVLLEAPLAELDAPHQEITCRRIDPELGMAGPMRRFRRGVVEKPELLDEAHRLVPGWWPALTAVLTGFRKLPVWAVMQIDIVESEAGPVVVDMTDQLDAAALQLDGPIMGSEPAIRFLKEFGV
ncbi:hypothetical protein ACFORG_01575 [Lutimaribacter marinistellae]|uniref:Alpha-L-glutamate ligase-related protein ATP-grasp domain-containing protein n=1 Tax=Lutimaribacter marinistellae TaxID=1820329 RepID=A0ABV7TA04_9RHOB